MSKRLVFICFLWMVTFGNAEMAEGDGPILTLDTGEHLSGIASLDVSGQNVVSASLDKSIRIWDLNTRKTIQTIWGQAGPGDTGSLCSALSSDKKFLAMGGIPGNWGVRILDYKSKEIIKTLPFDNPGIGEKNDIIGGLFFSKDGSRLMAYGMFKGVRIWDVASGQVLFEHTPKQDASGMLMGAAMSPDGGKVVFTTQKEMQMRRVDSGRKLFNKKNGTSYGVLHFLPKGDQFVASATLENSIGVFNAKSGLETKKVYSAKPHDESNQVIVGLTLSSDANFAAFAEQDSSTRETKSIKIIEMTNGEVVSSTNSFRNNVYFMAFSENGQTLITGAANGEVAFWDTTKSALSRLPSTMTRKVVRVGFSEDGRSIAWGYNQKLTHFLELNKMLPKQGDITGKNFHYAVHLAKGNKLVSESPYASMPSYKQLYLKSNRGREQIPVTMPTIKTLTHDGQKAYIANELESRIYSFDLSKPLPDATELPKLFHSDEGKLLGHVSGITSLAPSPRGHLLVSGSMDGTVCLWDTDRDELLASIYVSSDNEWIAWTPEGYFSCSPNGASLFGWRMNQGVNALAEFYPASQLYDDYYRPDLVQAKLVGQFDEMIALNHVKQDIAKVLSTGSAPSIEFLSPRQGELSDRDIEATIALTNQGGGIGKLVWKLNGVTIGIAEPGRGIALASKDSLGQGSVVKASKLLTLSPGSNHIEVMAYNAEGKIASAPAVLNISVKDAISEKPSLHVLAVGINKYRDKSLRLNYAVPDAKSLSQSIDSSGKSIFTNVSITEVYDQQATMSGIEQAFKTIGQKAKSHDVFILYLAGHGITLDGRYHFLPSDFRFRNEDSIRQSAITQDHLQDWMSQVSAQKSLVLLDTCNSGSFVQAQAVTRGLAEKTAIVKLTRATGRATIAASSDAQVALEGYEGHGVFTYALLQAMKEADHKNGNRDGVTSTAEIASYIDNTVPDLTYNKWGYEQVPQVNLHGREFPIGVTH